MQHHEMAVARRFSTHCVETRWGAAAPTAAAMRAGDRDGHGESAGEIEASSAVATSGGRGARELEAANKEEEAVAEVDLERRQPDPAARFHGG